MASLPQFEALCAGFDWTVPDRLNMGVMCSDVHPPGDRALVSIDAHGVVTTRTFGDLAETSGRLAGGLTRAGLRRGDRVAIVAPQSPEVGLAHLALWKLGAVSLPLASLFGPDAISYRLEDSGATMAIVSPDNLEKVREAAPSIPIVELGTSFEALCSGEPVDPADTGAEDPAFLIYTSGTTGQPKGALHAHRSIVGHLSGFELYYDFVEFAPMGRSELSVFTRLDPAPAPSDLIWTPADWAWIGGLMDVLIPAWYFGMPVLTAAHDFDPEWAAGVMAAQGVTLAFLPPTALKMMRAAGISRSDLALRAIFTGGEALGDAMLTWVRDHLGCQINEGYGQTEANLVVGNCASLFPVRPGSMGRAMPGHDVRVLNADVEPVVGIEGEIAVRAPDPVMMLEYWNRPQATADKYDEGWLLTGDLGIEDDDGYLWFRSRKDDVINSMGYRIGPGEIEASLMGHPSVSMCAVVGMPDEIRGQIPAAFVVLREGHEPSDELIDELQGHVRTRLAAHEVPRQVHFVADLPRTTTGKIMRRALRGR